MRLLGHFEDIAMGLMLWALFLVVGLQFFTRYVLNDSLGWTEEIARQMLIILTYAGSVVCARKSSHIQVDLLMDTLPDGAKAALNKFFYLISAIFFGFLAWTAVQFALSTRLMMSSIKVPKSIVYWFCALALAVMALHYLLHLVGAKYHQNDDEAMS